MDKLTFWNERANLGFKAGTNDEIMKLMEMQTISTYISDGLSVLDFGCGNGITVNYLLDNFNINIVGIDFSTNMICEAQKYTNELHPESNVPFIVGDETILKKFDKKFDIIYTERTLINLDSWEKQKEVIIDLCNLLTDNGRYIMCESSLDGLQKINFLREKLNLEPITPPWHNRYFLDKNIAELQNFAHIQLVEVNNFSSTYYFLSRVLNAALAAQANQMPSYDSPLNKLALSLPSIGDMGQGKIWVWKKKS